MMVWPAFSGHSGHVWKRRVEAADDPRNGRGPEEPIVKTLPPGRSGPNRIIFLNRFFFPDHSATSQILTDLAFHLASYGNEVRVVTSQQRYDDPDAHLPEAESIHGVAVY